MPTLEYRKLFRTNIVLKVTYKAVKKPSIEGIAFSKNISSTSINIVMTDRLENGVELELQIYISGDKKPVSAKGEIIWQADCSYVPASKRHYYATGIQFSYMSSEDAIKTSDFVRGILKKHSDAENKRIIETLEDSRVKQKE